MKLSKKSLKLWNRNTKHRFLLRIVKVYVQAAALKSFIPKILIRMEAMEKMAQNQETTILIIKKEAREQ